MIAEGTIDWEEKNLVFLMFLSMFTITFSLLNTKQIIIFFFRCNMNFSFPLLPSFHGEVGMNAINYPLIVKKI